MSRDRRQYYRNICSTILKASQPKTDIQYFQQFLAFVFPPVSPRHLSPLSLCLLPLHTPTSARHISHELGATSLVLTMPTNQNHILRLEFCQHTNSCIDQMGSDLLLRQISPVYRFLPVPFQQLIAAREVATSQESTMRREGGRMCRHEQVVPLLGSTENSHTIFLHLI
jgi:hypothetical protein